MCYITFIKVIHRLSQLLNNRNRYGLELKEPIMKCNVNTLFSNLDESYKYLSSITIENVSILKQTRKPFAVGF